MTLLRIVIVLLLTVGFSGSLNASDFLRQALKDGWGIRPLGMGNAYTAVAEGGAALYYNPAGIATSGGVYEIENMDYKKLRYEKFSSQSLYISPFAYSSWEVKSLAGESVNVVSYGYGRRGSRGIDWGVSYKQVKADTGLGYEEGWSTDLGLLVHMLPNLNIGVTAKDFFKQDVQVPATFRTGLSVFSQTRDFVLATDVVYKRGIGDASYNMSFGVEYAVADGLVLRGGWFENNYTAGADLVLPFIEIGYGVVSPVDNRDESFYMVGFKMGKGVETQKYKKRYSLFKPKSYAEFTLGRNLITGQSEVSFLGGAKVGSNDLLPLIHQAADDKSCEGFLIRLGSFSSSLTSVALIQEIREELEKAQVKGKKVYVFIEQWATLPEYYLASVADKIMMPELGTISHLGLEIEVKKTKQFLSNFGIEHEVITTGIYKGSMVPESDDVTDLERSLLEDLVGDLYHQVLFEIKASRKLDWDVVSHIFDGRFISATEAKEKGLVDELGYWDDLNEMAEKIEEKPISVVSLPEFGVIHEPGFIINSLNRIAVIEVDGEIHLGQNSRNMLFGGRTTGADSFDSLVSAVNNDVTIRGVVLRVNSPGGSIMAADRIYEGIEKMKEAGKIVYTSMGAIATSGGYYVSMNSHKIMANQGTLTGSIGVISSFKNVEGLNDLLGIETEVIKTGKYMDMMSRNRKLTEEEKTMFKDYQKKQYDHFVSRVKKNRSLTQEEATDVAQGQVFTGKQALSLKLIDEVGDFYDVVDELSSEIKIKKPELVYFRAKDNATFPLDLGFLFNFF